jgi:copper homeostasis protein
MTRNPFKSLEDLISLGIERVLTSGQESSCLEGLDVLTELVQKAGDKIIILPGGGITERNISRILTTCKAKEFHISGRTTRDSRMQFRNSRCTMGGALKPPEFSLSIVDSSKVECFLKNAK